MRIAHTNWPKTPGMPARNLISTSSSAGMPKLGVNL